MPLEEDNRFFVDELSDEEKSGLRDLAHRLDNANLKPSPGDIDLLRRMAKIVIDFMLSDEDNRLARAYYQTEIIRELEAKIEILEANLSDAQADAEKAGEPE